MPPSSSAISALAASQRCCSINARTTLLSCADDRDALWSHGNARPEGNFSATEILADLDLRVVRSLAHTRMLTIVFAMPPNAVAFRAKIDFGGTNPECRLSTEV